MANPDSFVGMSDEAFESQMNGTPSEESQEPHNEALSLSDEELDVTPDNDAELHTDDSGELTDDSPEEDSLDEKEVPSDDAEEVEESESTDSPETARNAELEELFKPFKASGREISVKSVEEAKKLMSMGADYANKLQGFKVHRKTIKTLAEHKIDDVQLNLLIDAHNGNPDAIAQLVKNHKLDALDLNTEEDTNYTPRDNSVSDSQVEMDDVIERIQSTPSFATTSDIVTNQWDAASKKVIFDSPRYLATLNEHVSNGTYERVMTEVSRARLFGGLQGVSDIEAYQQVGVEMQRRGDFNKPIPPAKVVSRRTAPVTSNTDKKLRASPSKGTPRSNVQPQYDYGAMKDEDFEKLLK